MSRGRGERSRRRTRVAIYTRVSTQEQAENGASLDAQKERLEAYCRSRDWRIVGVYVDDGHTGTDTHRPAYQRMMQERGKWDSVLVLKMDRIHRNTRNFMAMMDDLADWHKDFVSATESLDTSTAMGRFFRDMTQRMAQLESEVIGERTSAAMQQLRSQGYWVGGRHAERFFEKVREGKHVRLEAKSPLVGRALEMR